MEVKTDHILAGQLEKARKASIALQKLSNEQRQQILVDLATALPRHKTDILQANQADLTLVALSDPNRDRLMLDRERIAALAGSLHQLAALPDPTGQLLYSTHTPEGLDIQKITVPLGVVGVIYESRPNVTIDVAALCIRSGNVAILRGGTDARHTNACLVAIINEVLSPSGHDPAIVQLIAPERSLMQQFLTASRYIDVIIPRGSQALIEFVRKNSAIPVIETGAGVCHTYIESSASLPMAVDIVVNAKVSRPSVCNALDTVLIDREVARPFLKSLADDSLFTRVEVFADPEAWDILHQAGFANLQPAANEDFGREFLDYKCSIKIVSGPAEAFAHIARYSSRHSEAIVTEDRDLQEQFLQEIDAAAVYINASTRFTDGAVFGLGAEIGISTQKLHARGPFALEKLVTEKWLVRGSGQTRK